MAEHRKSTSILTFTLLAIGAIAILISLGNWQARRLVWKEKLIADTNARLAAAPTPAPGPGQWQGLNWEQDVYRKVTLEAAYDHGREVHVWFALKNPKGGSLSGPGYLILTAATTPEGWHVIINRGFVPEAMKEAQSRPQTLVTGLQQMPGLMRFDEPKSWLSPKADKKKNVWIVRQVEEMAAFLGLDPAKTAPYWIDLSKGQGVDGLPQGGETRVAFTNSHFQYMLTWYGLAVVLLVVYGLWLVRTIRTSRSGN